MRLVLALAVVIAAAGITASVAPSAARRPCVVPRLYALRLAAARTLIAASGCTLGGIAYERPRAAVARVTDQVPPPGAILPASARVYVIVT